MGQRRGRQLRRRKMGRTHGRVEYDGFFRLVISAASGAPFAMKTHGTIVLLVCTMGNSRALNTMVPSKIGRNDVFIALIAKEGSWS